MVLALSYPAWFCRDVHYLIYWWDRQAQTDYRVLKVSKERKAHRVPKERKASKERKAPKALLAFLATLKSTSLCPLMIKTALKEAALKAAMCFRQDGFFCPTGM
jgi:hypothetical protein|tara:strand:- start:178 stop:489 length:312 start_codon:yes stop_codon:yes gene_type:complete